jgi:BarA-like signal transduction histidine kinase
MYRYGSVKEALAHYHRALQLLEPHQTDPAVTELVLMVRPTIPLHFQTFPTIPFHFHPFVLISPSLYLWQTRNNLGLAMTQLGDVSSAVLQHQLVLSLLPCSAHFHPRSTGPSGFVGGPLKCRGEAMQATSHVYRARRSVCDWTQWEETLDELLRDMDVRILQEGYVQDNGNLI